MSGCEREKSNNILLEERESWLKNTQKNKYNIWPYCAIDRIIELYCSKCQIFFAFDISDAGLVLVFNVSNTKNLAFGTIDVNAL